MAEGGHRAVAGNERGLVAHRPEPLRDRFDELLLIAAREVPAADGTLEQHVADQRQVRFRVMEHDVAWRVARAMADIEGEFPNGDLIAVLQPARRLERSARDAILPAVLAKAVDPEAVVLVGALDFDAELLGEDACASAMIDMTVRQQDLLDRDAGLLRRSFQAREVAAGIDEGAAHR